MKLDEIAKAATTFSIDPDEARILAAACRIGADYAMDHGSPTEDPFSTLSRDAQYLISATLEGYAAFFEAAGMAAYVQELFVSAKDQAETQLSEIRKDGMGYRLVSRKNSEAGNAV